MNFANYEIMWMPVQIVLASVSIYVQETHLGMR